MMKYVKKPKYRLNKLRISIPKNENISAADIYKEMLKDKTKRRKHR